MNLLVAGSLLAVFLGVVDDKTYTPPNGYVPDKGTAVKIAEAVLAPVYGKSHIKSERPFKADLKDGVWIVSGTLHCPQGKGGEKVLCVGGTATVEISKTDGRIISMVHYK